MSDPSSSDEEEMPRNGRRCPQQQEQTWAPIMTLARRRELWPPETRLDFRELRLLYWYTGATGQARQRHNIAPYAFNKKGQPYLDFKSDKVQDLGDEYVLVQQRHYEDWPRQIGEVVTLAQSNGLDRATERVRQLFRPSQPEPLQRTQGVVKREAVPAIIVELPSDSDADTDVEVVRKEEWNLRIDLKKQWAKLKELEAHVLRIPAGQTASTTTSTAGADPAMPIREAERDNNSTSESSITMVNNRVKDANTVAESSRTAETRRMGENSPRPNAIAGIARSTSGMYQVAAPTLSRNDRPPANGGTKATQRTQTAAGWSQQEEAGPSNRRLPPEDCPDHPILNFEFRNPVLTTVPPFNGFVGEHSTWYKNIERIARCRNEAFHNPALIRACKKIVDNEPVGIS